MAEIPDESPAEGAESRPAASDGPVSAEAVRDYLSRHPGFLAENAAILLDGAEAMPEGVVDLQRYIVDGLRQSLRQREKREGLILAAAEDRAAAVRRVHDATIAVLSAGSLEALAGSISADLPRILGIAVAVLAVEGGANGAADAWPDGVVRLQRKAFARLIGVAAPVRLGRVDDEIRRAVGAPLAAARSLAVIRTAPEDPGPRPVLVLAAADTEAFEEGQGTELLAYLGRVVGLGLARWSPPPS